MRLSFKDDLKPKWLFSNKDRQTIKKEINYRLSAMQARRHGEHSGAVPSQTTACAPNQELCPPSEDCVPKKVTGLVPLECSLRPETPKYWSSPQNSWAKTVFFAAFATKTFFLVFILEFEGTQFLCPLKNCVCPPVTLIWRRSCSYVHRNM